ncbi:MAG: ABC transporter substrate-binding protein [Spirochaetaceae bacterium]|nr:ABC transporter substrate-binding protein [Spirochaetaceae bacterium]
MLLRNRFIIQAKEKMKPKLAVFSIIFCIILVSSCFDKKTQATSSAWQENKPKSLSKSKIERIISLAPSNTEIIVDLGLADKLIACDRYSKNIEGIAQELPEIDPFYPDIEAIIGLSPDIVIVSGLKQSDSFALLHSAGIAVSYIPMSHSIEGIYQDIRFIADLLNKAEGGQELITEMKTDIALIVETAQTIDHKKTVYFEIDSPPNIAALGRETYLNEMIEIIGAVNIFGKERGILFPDNEEIINRNPDVIMTNTDYIHDAVSAMKNRAGFELITAVKNNAVFLINANSSSRPSSRIIYALREMACAAYPEYYSYAVQTKD